MNTYGELAIWFHVFLTSALDGGELSASRTGRFTPGERAPCSHWIAGWKGARSSLEAVAKRRIRWLCLELYLTRSDHSPVTELTELLRMIKSRMKWSGHSGRKGEMRYQWRALVSTVMKFRVPKKTQVLPEWLKDYHLQGWPYSMELLDLSVTTFY
jgi:hypothetical protein